MGKMWTPKSAAGFITMKAFWQNLIRRCIFWGLTTTLIMENKHTVTFCLLLLLSWNLPEERKKLLLSWNNLKNILNDLAFCEYGKANTLIFEKSIPQIIWNGWLVHQRAFPGIFPSYATSCTWYNMVIKCFELFCAVCLPLSFQVPLEICWLLSVHVDIIFCPSFHGIHYTSLESCSAATEHDLNETTISLNCLLKEYIDVSPVT